jgi:hypothetical protein
MKTNARIDLGRMKCQTPKLEDATPCWNTLNNSALLPKMSKPSNEYAKL